MKTIYQLFLQSSGISIDSRKISQNCIFFALKGENFNGNHFAIQALKQGAFCAVIDEHSQFFDEDYHSFLNEGRIILVDNALKALQQLAQYHRLQLKNTKILAVGGSNGKTTTKELIFRVLNTHFRTFATLGNLNNHIGVPLTLLQIPQDCQIAIIEMGANHAQEIAELCAIALPDMGVITNIGFDHLEGFGSIEGVAKANAELFDFLENKENTIAFRNTNEPFLAEMTEKMTKKTQKIITYPTEKDDFCVIQKENSFFVEYSRNNKQNIFIKTQLLGKHNFYNIATALCIADYFGVPTQKADEAITNYTPQNNRSQILEKNTNMIVLDAYNANPSSMKSALEAFANMQLDEKNEINTKVITEKTTEKTTKKAIKKVVILGEMLEMGEHSPEMHENLGKFVKNLAFEEVILYGNDMQFALSYLPKAYYFTDKFSLHNWLADKKYTNTYFLIKGSRGAKLETTLEFLD
jgi:UDP-N-acetylmuramoyl-tripeptide--D-alanyl-D-alanine ligase